jgi:hypothetical protein
MCIFTQLPVLITRRPEVGMRIFSFGPQSQLEGSTSTIAVPQLFKELLLCSCSSAIAFLL